MKLRIQSNYDNDSLITDQFAPVEIEHYEVGGERLARIANLRPVESGRYRGLEANIQPLDYPAPRTTPSPVWARRRGDWSSRNWNEEPIHVVALGMGTDSIAMLIAMRDRGIRPDVVQWADTGSERAHTYAYVNTMIAWLKANDFPPLLIVRKRCPQAGHRSLYEQLWNTEQLPSPAFHRNHSCSAKWKLEPQRDYHSFLPWMNGHAVTTAIGFSAEETSRQIHGAIRESIGFSAEESGRKSYQVKDDDGYVTTYPLQEWGITRQDCVDLIAAEGLPQPGKSACFFCPMSRRCEVKQMPENELRASFALEDRAEAGGKLKKIRGLRKGVNEKWSEWLAREADEDDREFVGLIADPIALPKPTPVVDAFVALHQGF
jgi:hypothetical protein